MKKSFTVYLIFLTISMGTYAQMRQKESITPTDNREQLLKERTHLGERLGVRDRNLPADAARLQKDEFYGYGWVTQSMFFPTGSVRISFQNGEVTYLAEVDASEIKMAGGDFADGTWYAVSFDEFNSGLYTIDTISGAYSLIGSTGEYLSGLAYHLSDRVMYASGLEGGNSFLYTVDLASGEATLVGEICSGKIVGIAADALGNLYGINEDDNMLYAIDRLTGEGISIGNLGIEIMFGQDIGFDRDNNTLYGHLYGPTAHNPNHFEGALYQINTQTGQVSLVWYNNFEISCFAIPYTAPLADVPSAVTSAVITADDQGALQAVLSWTNPSETYGGQPLNDFSSVVIERQGEVVQTIENPVAGEQVVFTDQVPEEGVYEYMIYAVNSAGTSPKRPLITWVGHDVPSAPNNVSLAASENEGHISWDHPSTGLHGGYFTTTGLTYTIFRYPGEVTVAENITDSEFFDNTVPGMGIYQYRVTASNHVGQGGSELTEYELLQASDEVLFFDNFSYTPGQLPVGWSIMGEPSENWTVEMDNGAGGEIPELWFNWQPNFDGVSRIMSPYIDIMGNTNLRLVFRQMLVNYPIGSTELIGVDITTDGGTSWIALWENTIGYIDLEAAEYELGFSIDPGVEGINIAFRFEGSSTNINQWKIDDVLLTPALENDLQAGALAGSIVIASEEPNTFTLEITNTGSQTQTDYTVKLMKEDGTILATTSGIPVGFTETKYLELEWTPSSQGQGITSIYGLVELAGDENPENNEGESLQVIVTPQGTVPVEIGNEENTSGITPFSFYSLYSLAQTIYYPEDLVLSMGTITGIIYKSKFQDPVEDVPVKIWLGETSLADLSDEWTEAGDLELVFDGLVDFPAGMGNVYIPFDDNYMYSGGNLLVFTYKEYDQEVYNNSFFTSWDPTRIRSRYNSDSEPLDPYQTPDYHGDTYDYPNIHMLFSASGQGAIEGTVNSEGEAVNGVKVTIAGTNVETFTGNDGSFVFPYVNSGNLTLEFSKHGYIDHSTEVVVEEGSTTSLVVTLDKIAVVTVNGKLTGNDNPGQGISNTTIKLEGYDNYSVQTDDQGNFSFGDVYIDRSYTLDILLIGYYRYTENIEVGSQNLDLGTIELERIANPVGEVQATETLQGAMINWQQPVEPQEMISQHDGVPEEFFYNYQWGFRVYGTVFDLEDYPDAKISFIDFYHLSWEMPEDNYPYLVHIVDWNNFEILTTVGPLNTQVTDNWEEQVELGHYDVGGYDKIGILIQPQGNGEANAYPNIATDCQGTNGLSVNAMVDNLQDYNINSDNMGDFLINLWVTSNYGSKQLIKASGYKQEAEAKQSHAKDLTNYRVFRLAEGQEEETESWTALETNVTDTLYLDSDWLSLPEGSWKYAVMAEYSHQYLSGPKFSNTLYKPLSAVEPEASYFRIFPNPATQGFSIHSPEQMIRISMIDLTGRMVYSTNLQSDQHEINTDGFQPGLYLLRIQTKKGIKHTSVQVM